jgi:hypothetical protein
MIAIRYKNELSAEPDHDDPYIEGEHLDDDDNPTQKVYYTIDAKRPILNTNLDSGNLLNGRYYAHLLYKHYKYKFVISANEITEDDINFFERYWSALTKFIAIETNGTFGNYIEVETNGGALPIEYIDGVESMPEIILEITTVNGV